MLNNHPQPITAGGDIVTGTKQTTTFHQQGQHVGSQYNADQINIFPPAPSLSPGSAVARLNTNISEVLPYLNATLSGAIYNQAAQALTWKQVEHSMALHPYKIAVSNLKDRGEAEQVINQIIDSVNHTWEQRAEIEPDFEMRQRPAPMALFKLLPGTNCRRCGQPTCFTFALKLAAGQQKPDACPPLFEPEFAEQLETLQTLVANMPPG